MTRQATVVLADDHAIVLDGLRSILEPEFEVAATAADGRSLVKAVRKLQPDVAVTDIAMPGLNGLEALRQIKQARLKTKVVLLTGSLDVKLATQAFRLGASAYVLKHSAAEELVTAVRAVIAGKTYITPRIAQDVIQNLMETPVRPSESTLTPREREVLQLLAEGRTLKEAAAVLDVSPRTIEFHRNNIADKTGLRTTAELARYAVREGILPESI